MSLARAFTTRKGKFPSVLPQRSATTKAVPSGTIRHKISAPVELLSTTNMLSYNAPDLHSSSGASVSGDESDTLPSLVHSPGTSSSANSTVDSMPNSPEPNHLSCYFGKAGRESTSSNEDSAPKIPSRASSHTKRNHEIIHRQRSISRRSSQRKANITAFARDSLNMFSSSPEILAAEEQAHPFGNELAQVTELAEEFGVRDQMQVVDAEEQDLISRGLFKFQAQDYMEEIQALFLDTYGTSSKPSAMWI